MRIGMKWRLAMLAAGVLGTCLGVPGRAVAKDLARVKGEMESTGVDPEASARLIARFKPEKSQLLVKAEGLTPGALYVITVDGVSVAELVASSSGKIKQKFSTSTDGGSLPLSFDPRGKIVAVNDGASVVLEMAVSTEGEPLGTKVDERTSLAPTALAPGGKAEARVRVSKDGRTTFKVEIEDVPAGSYDLFVDGVLRAAITVSGVEGEVEFDSLASPPKLPLDFDPRGAIVDIAQGTDVFFSGEMRAQATGVTQCQFAETETFLTSTGVDPDAKAKARLRVREDCDRDFRVEIEDVPVGNYDLFVGGVLRAVIAVADTGDEIEGEAEFDSDPDEANEILLDFDPDGAMIEISQSGTAFFSQLFDASAPGGPDTCTESELEEPIASTGVDPDADGSARFRTRDDCEQDFQVEIEDVPLGSYELRVDGVLRGTITVVDNAGDIEGEIEFDTDPDGSALPLDFDPNGKLIEVAQGATVFFSDTFGSGGTGGPTICEPTEDEVPLLNTGPVGSAKGKARFRVKDDCDEDFRVEIEDLPLGNYTLEVGGVAVGTISVVLDGGEAEGEVEFDDDPDEPGELLLTFDPRDALVQVIQSGTVFLERVFPGS